MKILGTFSLVMASSSLLLLASLFMAPASALFCWKNSDSSANTEWEIQECNMTNNETSCLAQYRLYNGKKLTSYFGCHTTEIPCNYNCDVIEGQRNSFSCCCSSDLCNKVEHVAPSPAETQATEIPPPIPPPDGCQNAGCSDRCIEHKGRPQCYCESGYILDGDERTCIDLDECAYNNGGCEGVCHNENGTGYHCSCHDNQILAEDGFHCEDFSGLVCYSKRCEGNYCPPVTIEVCGDTHTNSHQHCQATYIANESGDLEVRLQSCFSGSFSCEKGGCTPTQINSLTPIYHCCCDGHLCNGNITQS